MSNTYTKREEIKNILLSTYVLDEATTATADIEACLDKIEYLIEYNVKLAIDKKSKDDVKSDIWYEGIK